MAQMGSGEWGRSYSSETDDLKREVYQLKSEINELKKEMNFFKEFMKTKGSFMDFKVFKFIDENEEREKRLFEEEQMNRRSGISRFGAVTSRIRF